MSILEKVTKNSLIYPHITSKNCHKFITTVKTKTLSTNYSYKHNVSRRKIEKTFRATCVICSLFSISSVPYMAWESQIKVANDSKSHQIRRAAMKYSNKTDTTPLLFKVHDAPYIHGSILSFKETHLDSIFKVCLHHFCC